MIRKWDMNDKDAKKKCVDEVIARIEEIGDSQAGFIAAQDIIEIVSANLGPEIYNMALGDVKKLLQQKFGDLEVDIDLLEQSA